jgi:hypothetical protein
MNNRLISALFTVFTSGVFNALVYLLWVSNSTVDFSFLLVMSLVGGLVVLGFTVVWGLPLHFLLRRKKMKELRYYLVIGALPCLGIPVDYMLGGYYSNIFGHTLFFCFVGVISALLFWKSVKVDA